MRPRSLVLGWAGLLLLAGCTPQSGPDRSDEGYDGPAPCETQIWYADADGDGHGSALYPREVCDEPEGHVAQAGDCDDLDADVYPGAGEICDGVDQDCNGEVDESASDAPLWYRDQDGDGYGVVEDQVPACDQPDGYAAVDGDCDDADAAVSPGATEVYYDGFDQNCDGWSDYDADQDGHDHPDFGGDDCDDAEASTFPGADEVCDGVDQDCDDAVDEDAIDAPSWYPDSDADGYGGDAEVVRDCTQPPDTIALGGDCDDANDRVHPLADEICGDGIDNDCDGGGCGILGPQALAIAGSSFVAGLSYQRAASSLALSPDITGDGVPDIIVGADGWFDYTTVVGQVYVLSGVPSAGSNLAATATHSFRGAATHNSEGAAVATADLDGDGWPELLIGAPRADGVDTEGGSVWIHQGPITASVRADAGDWYLHGHDGEQAGMVLATPGDLDGDGWADLLVGAPRADTQAEDAGLAYLLYGPVTGNTLLESVDDMLLPEARYDRMPAALAGAGDLDGDGVQDLLAGAYGDSDEATGQGAVYVLHGPTEGAVDVGDGAGLFWGRGDDDAVGSALLGPGDLTGDGLDDVLVGAPGDDSAFTDAGAVYLVAGPASGLQVIDAAALGVLQGPAGDAAAGAALSWLGDVDGDGDDELAVGAPHADADTANAGTVYILGGVFSGTVDLGTAPGRHWGTGDGDLAGGSLAGGQDLDGDGFPDLVIGAPELDGSGFFVGGGYVLLGGEGL